MGAQVERLSRRAAVASESANPTGGFGHWLEQQRQLRGISIWFVAARTKLAPERIEAIERGELLLPTDPHGRGTARVLARAIGADPDWAVAQLLRASRDTEARTPAVATGSRLRIGGTLGAVVMVGLGVWLIGMWLGTVEAVEVREDAPPRIYRPDYVGRLLGGDLSH